MKDYQPSDVRIFIGCTVLLVVVFALDIVFRWTAGGILYLFVIMLALRSSKNRDVYFFAGMTSLLLLTSWRLSPSTAKIWHVSIALIWVTAILVLRFKKVRIIKSTLSAIVDSSHDAIVGKTLSNVVLSWNQAAENLFGYTKKEMVGRSADCLIPEDRVEDERRLIAELKSGKASKPYQTIFRHKGGHFIQVSLTLSPIKDPYCNIVGISSIARDISERITAEKKWKN